MAENDLLLNARVAILGLGLMGGSLAMALRGKCASLLGVDPNPDVLALARIWHLADQTSELPAELLPQADLVILAAPVRAILKLLADLPDLHPGSAVVLDLGSTKSHIVQAMQSLPERFDPIGGHPMCGKESSSLANAEAGLFQGAPFAFTPLARTTARARRLAEEIASVAGALPLWFDAETHDRWVASTSHLPYLVANTLAAATPTESAPLVGPGFRSTARLAPTSLTMMLDILTTNRSNVLSSLHEFQERLARVENSLAASDEQALRQLLLQGTDNYAALINPPANPPRDRKTKV